MFFGHPYLYWIEPFGVIGPHRGQNNKKPVGERCAYPQKGIGSHNSRPYIKRRSRSAWHPVFFQFQELFERVEGCIFVKCGYAKLFAGTVHAFEIVCRAKKLDTARIGAIGLQPFKHSLTIVQHHGRRVHGYGSVGFDSRIVPPLFDTVVHIEHMVGEYGAETEVGFIRFGFQSLGFCNGQLHHILLVQK